MPFCAILYTLQMTQNQWQAFVAFRDAFRTKCSEWAKFASRLTPLATAAAEKDTPPYVHETAVVYNCALDDITEKSEIRYIVVGDNPGKDEQLAKNNRYLVGQSGKLAANFFARNAELCAGFRQNVIILNKTPIHTAKTNHLKYLVRADSEIAALIAESQKWMAEQTARLHIALADSSASKDALVSGCASAGGKDSASARASVGGGELASGVELWLVGYAELKKKGIFSLYRETLAAAYEITAITANAAPASEKNHTLSEVQTVGRNPAWQRVMAFQHFSMNRFSIDLKAHQRDFPTESLRDALFSLGTQHRVGIFGK